MSPVHEPVTERNHCNHADEFRSRRQRLQKFDFAQRSVSLTAAVAAGPLVSRSAVKTRSVSRRRFSPPTCQARSCQKSSSALRFPRKILRSAFLILATLIGCVERGRSHLPSPQYCQRCQKLHGAVARG